MKGRSTPRGYGESIEIRLFRGLSLALAGREEVHLSNEKADPRATDRRNEAIFAEVNACNARGRRLCARLPSGTAREGRAPESLLRAETAVP